MNYGLGNLAPIWAKRSKVGKSYLEVGILFLH